MASALVYASYLWTMCYLIKILSAIALPSYCDAVLLVVYLLLLDLAPVSWCCLSLTVYMSVRGKKKKESKGLVNFGMLAVKTEFHKLFLLSLLSSVGSDTVTVLVRRAYLSVHSLFFWRCLIYNAISFFVLSSVDRFPCLVSFLMCPALFWVGGGVKVKTDRAPNTGNIWGSCLRPSSSLAASSCFLISADFSPTHTLWMLFSASGKIPESTENCLQAFTLCV